jgi:hypothetical protein
VATISTYDIAAQLDLSPYKNILRWYELCKATIPGYALNVEGTLEFKKLFNNSN